ncbi:50S ribosomal protein L18Ae [Candidatus Alkanophaga liquidiphilum]
MESLSEKLAIEKVLSIMGSKHRLKRNMIRIKSVVQQGSDGEATSSMSMASSSS